MAKAAVFFADGFEEVEALTVVDLLRRAEVEVDMVGAYGEKQVTGSHGIKVVMDKSFEAVDFENMQLLVLPGGMPGTKNLEEHEELIERIKEFYNSDKKIAAICAAPGIFGKLGLLAGKRAVSYPTVEERLTDAVICKNSVEVDGNITTSRGLGTAIDFSLSLIEQLRGKELAAKIKKSIIY